MWPAWNIAHPEKKHWNDATGLTAWVQDGFHQGREG